MILLEPSNRIIQETLENRFKNADSEKPDVLELKFADFDGVTYHIHTPDLENRTLIRFSMAMRGFQSQLAQYGALEILRNEFAGLILEVPTDGYDVTIEFDTKSVPADQQIDLIRKLSLLKVMAMSAPFEVAFESQIGNRETEFMTVDYRDQESLYVKASHDRVTVIFSVLFRDETDKILAKVFLQEFVDCRRLPALQNAPQALYTGRDPPLDLKNVPGVMEGDNYGYVTFVLFPRHFEKPSQRLATIQLIQFFRDYLQYHIKCSKAYMHSRMRAKVESWTKVLNRAKPDAAEKEKKLASGKTFVRK